MKYKIPLSVLTVAGVITLLFLAPAAYAKMTASSVPPSLISYIAQHSGSSGCVSGTLDPFTITSTKCPSSPNDVINGVPNSTCGNLCVTGPPSNSSTSALQQPHQFTIPRIILIQRAVTVRYQANHIDRQAK